MRSRSGFTSENVAATIVAPIPLPVIVTPVGVHGNAWLAAVVGVGGNSAIVDTQFTPHVTIFGTTSGVTTITIKVSQTLVPADFVDGPTVASVGPNFNFVGNVTIGARYVRLQTSLASTITATIAAKG